MPLTCIWLLSYRLFGCPATEQKMNIPISVYEDTGNTQLSQTNFSNTVFFNPRNHLSWKTVNLRNIQKKK